MQVGRNSPCPCGSGKKYKRCCLAGGEFEQATQSQPTLEQTMETVNTAISLADLARARKALEPILAGLRPSATALKLAYSIEMRDRDFAGAAGYMLQLLEQDPGDTASRANYATALALAGELSKAAEVFESVLTTAPELWSAYPNYANTLRDLGRSREAAECYQKAFNSGTLDLLTMSQIMLTMHLFVVEEHDMLYTMHQRLGSELVKACPVNAPSRDVLTIRDRIRIGYVSPRFSRHIVGYFFKPLFDHHNRDKFAVYLYSATRDEDDLTDYFSSAADQWRDISTYSDAALRRQIVDDEIDILIDLAGHAPENRMSALACKPAPVQISMIDYFDSTGVPAIDYYVTDHYSTPEDSPQQFVEELLYLEQPRLVYEAPAYAPEVQVRGVNEAGIVFGSFNRHHKIVPEVIQTWAGLLNNVPDSRLLLKSASFAEVDVQDSFLARFAALGVAADRIEFRGLSPHKEMLAEYADMDIALDTFPYNGGLTTCEALWMGTPVITMLGHRVISRQTAAMLNAVGLGQFVADTPREFADIGRHWAENREMLNRLRLDLRQQMSQSKLTDGASYAADLEAQLQRIWQGVCPAG
jgi:protein O-GlcNAc transferase